MIEREENAPTVDALEQLSDALSIDPISFFQSDQTTSCGDPAEERSQDRNAMTVIQLCSAYLAAATKGLILGKGGRPKKPSTLYVDRGRIERHILPLLGTKIVRKQPGGASRSGSRSCSLSEKPLSEAEFAIRRRGYVKSLADIEQIVVKNNRGVPVFVRGVARVELAPDERRGITEVTAKARSSSKLRCGAPAKTRSPSSTTSRIASPRSLRTAGGGLAVGEAGAGADAPQKCSTAAKTSTA